MKKPEDYLKNKIKDCKNTNSIRLDTKKLYEKRVCVANLGGKFWYTAEVRRLGFLWRSRWKELKPAMQPTYEDAVKLFSNYA